jgi:hypothetical protein
MNQGLRLQLHGECGTRIKRTGYLITAQVSNFAGYHQIPEITVGRQTACRGAMDVGMIGQVNGVADDGSSRIRHAGTGGQNCDRIGNPE